MIPVTDYPIVERKNVFFISFFLPYHINFKIKILFLLNSQLFVKKSQETNGVFLLHDLDVLTTLPNSPNQLENASSRFRYRKMVRH